MVQFDLADRPNIDAVHKFGEAPDFDTNDGTVCIWDGADDANIDQMTCTYSTSADITTLTSSDNGDTQVIEIQGLDTNLDAVTQNVTLTGQTEATLGTSLKRVFRMKNTGATDNAGHVYCFVGTGSTNGVPDTGTDTRAIIQPGLNQTLMAIYTIPNGRSGYMTNFWAAESGTLKAGTFIVSLYAREEGGVFQLKHRSGVNSTGTSHFQHNNPMPMKFTEKTDLEMRVQANGVGITAASMSGGFDLILTNN